ncbi:MAG: type 1 glutamine amidotransferase [Deltaproteobacteria bacterium]|nr:type 1 glutamine amidotransferase [Deltaproteobacteria bacterium]
MTHIFLLLQAREPGDPAAAQEVDSFAEALEVPRAAVRPWDLLQGAPTARDLEPVDALLVGGSGAFSVLDSHPWIHDFMDFLEETSVHRRFPTFASCFGFQALVVAGGGRVVKDSINAELGTFDILLTEQGQADPLLGPLAPSFPAQLGHKDRADELPSDCIPLAYSALCPYQCFRVQDAPVVATQFHPELTREGEAFRCRTYASMYQTSGVAAEMQRVIESLRESPQASALMRRWVEQTL